MWDDYEIKTTQSKPYLKPTNEPLCEEARQAVVMHLIERKRGLQSEIFEIDRMIHEINMLGSVDIEL